MPDETQYTPPDEKGEEEPQYATKADLAAIAEAIEGLKSQAGGSGNDDPTDPNAINRLYDEMVGSKPAEEADADPMQARLERMEKALGRMGSLVDNQWRAGRRAEIDAEFSAKYEDWTPNKAEIWKLAKQHPSLDGDQAYVLWKLSKYGPEGLTQKEQKVATDAAKKSTEAKAASSEKPGVESAGKQRESESLGELLSDTWDKMPAKPVFQ